MINSLQSGAIQWQKLSEAWCGFSLVGLSHSCFSRLYGTQLARRGVSKWPHVPKPLGIDVWSGLVTVSALNWLSKTVCLRTVVSNGYFWQNVWCSLDRCLWPLGKSSALLLVPCHTVPLGKRGALLGYRVYEAWWQGHLSGLVTMSTVAS